MCVSIGAVRTTKPHLTFGLTPLIVCNPHLENKKTGLQKHLSLCAECRGRCIHLRTVKCCEKSASQHCIGYVTGHPICCRNTQTSVNAVGNGEEAVKRKQQRNGGGAHTVSDIFKPSVPAAAHIKPPRSATEIESNKHTAVVWNHMTATKHTYTHRSRNCR